MVQYKPIEIVKAVKQVTVNVTVQAYRNFQKYVQVTVQIYRNVQNCDYVTCRSISLLEC